MRFDAPEVGVDGRIGIACWGFDRTTDGGWCIVRAGQPMWRLGPGYRSLRVSHAGICATDLARARLPFALPQVTGHEVIALDPAGQPVAIEINASHAARALPVADWCEHCRAGLDTHCPDRLVLGIDRLPGGFGPWVLAPAAAIVPLPASLDLRTAVLLEPFAAAWHAVQSIDAADGARVAVLGVGRLGLLVVAALAAWRARTRRTLRIVALARRPEPARLARRLGADEAMVGIDPGRSGADVVIETSGTPEGLALALHHARAEVHLKSTTGRPVAGLVHATELVVDELGLHAWNAAAVPSDARHAAVLARDPRGHIASALQEHGCTVVAGTDPAELAERIALEVPLGGVDLAVVDSVAAVDLAVRPRPGIERALVRPRGRILLAPGSTGGDVAAWLLGGRRRVTSSRCGRFAEALPVLAAIDDAIEGTLGAALVTAVLPALQLAEGQALARRPEHVKVVMRHRVAGVDL